MSRKSSQPGAIGINFEDQVVGGEGLHAITDQAARIAAVRRAADQAGVPLFINARTDVFLKAKAEDHAGLLDQALARAKAYAAAGADGFFVPGLTDAALIPRIVEGTSLPVNVMIRGALTSVAACSKAWGCPHQFRARPLCRGDG